MRNVLLPVRQKAQAPSTTPNDTRYPMPAIAAGVISAAAAAGLTWLAPLADSLLWMVPAIGAVTGGLIAASLKVADEWEKAVVLRMGKYRGLRGPGMFWVTKISTFDRKVYEPI